MYGIVRLRFQHQSRRLRAANGWPTPLAGKVRRKPARKTTTLDQHDDYFAPTCIRVPWNKPVRLVATNLGHMPHTVTVDGTPLDTDVDSGETVFVTVPATKVPLQIVCTFHIKERMFAAVIPVKGLA